MEKLLFAIALFGVVACNGEPIPAVSSSAELQPDPTPAISAAPSTSPTPILKSENSIFIRWAPKDLQEKTGEWAQYIDLFQKVDPKMDSKGTFAEFVSFRYYILLDERMKLDGSFKVLCDVEAVIEGTMQEGTITFVSSESLLPASNTQASVQCFNSYGAGFWLNSLSRVNKYKVINFGSDRLMQISSDYNPGLFFKPY